MAKILWVATDCLGKEVEFSDATWQNKVAKRPYMASYLDEVRKTVEEPEVCIRDSTNAYHNYRLGILRGRYRGTYLRAIVRRIRGKKSRVVSFWASKKIDPGEIVWFNKSN